MRDWLRAVMPRNRVGRVGHGTWHELFSRAEVALLDRFVGPKS